MEDFFINTVGIWFVGMFKDHPTFISFVMFLGLIRLCVKPIMTILQIYVKWTPYDSDDKWLTDMEQSKGYKLALYLLDWILSIKGPQKENK